jgi:hypothetical protein
MRAWEPRLCAELTAQRREFAKCSWKELGQRLEGMLNESPPPSLREVHARLGITQAISYGNFPEIHRAIAARHQEFQRRSRHQNTQLGSAVRGMLGKEHYVAASTI